MVLKPGIEREEVTAVNSVATGSVEHHQNVLFGEIMLGNINFLELYYHCMNVTGTGQADWKWYRRPERALHLAQYFRYAMKLEGEKCECGVFRGFSALMLNLLAKQENPVYSGEDFHIVDSFEGLSQPGEEDLVEIQKPDGIGIEKFHSNAAGTFSTPIEHVDKVLTDYDQLKLYKGWIPDVLDCLPEKKWSFVHIDVDLYEPTLNCLEYFYPRMTPGGVIINDDFSSPAFPGGGKSWTEFCAHHGVPFVELDTGQAVIIKS